MPTEGQYSNAWNMNSNVWEMIRMFITLYYLVNGQIYNEKIITPLMSIPGANKTDSDKIMVLRFEYIFLSLKGTG
jgi:hypothetical protein